jgi:putative transposase
MGTSGSECGPGKPTSRKADRAPRSDPSTYINTHTGWVDAAFIIDVFSRLVVGWQGSTSLRTEWALDALDMGLWNRARAGHNVTGLTHHCDRGVQYRAIRYSERLAEESAVASVGSQGDSYNNAMAEAFNSTVQRPNASAPPVIRPKDGWNNISEAELAVAEYIDWFNHRRPHDEIGLIPPAEIETNHWATLPARHYSPQTPPTRA